MALSTTSYANDKGLKFPFVTIPDYEVQASNARELSDTDVLAFAPLVHRDLMGKWGNYSVNNQGWLRQSLDFIGRNDVDPGQVTPKIKNPRDFSDPNHNQGMHPDLANVAAPIWYGFANAVRSTIYTPMDQPQKVFSTLVSFVQAS